MSAAVNTVLGPVSPAALGRILPHEHILGANGKGLSLALEFDPPPVDEIIAQHEPLLTELRRQGCDTIVEVSPTGLRRREDVEAWAGLSRRTGVNIVASTGYYVGATRPASFGEPARRRRR